MGEIDWDWVGIGSLLLAAVALILGVARGQIKLGLDGGPSIEQRLARYPVSARAVIIKAQRQRAMRRAAPGLVAMLAFGGALLYLQHGGVDELCQRLGPARSLQYLLMLMFYGLPGFFVALALYESVKAAKVLRGGYRPPLDAVLFHDTVAISGWRAKAHGLVGVILLPALAAWVIYVGHSGYEHFAADVQARFATNHASQCLSLSRHR